MHRSGDLGVYGKQDTLHGEEDEKIDFFIEV